VSQELTPAEIRQRHEAELRRDAQRYRALVDAVARRRIWAYENGFTIDRYINTRADFEALAEKLVTEQEQQP
jgi:hypothetical protein